MYINPFWVGVAAAFLFEFAALIVAAIVLEVRRRKRKKRAQELLEKKFNNMKRGATNEKQ